MPPPRTYSSVAHPLGHGSAIVPEYLSRSPLAPTRQLVAEATRWKESYLREREPLLTHPTVQGLQKVHDEWHRESASQKALLHVHLAAAVERLECLESNETRHLEHIKEFEQRLQERCRELVDLNYAPSYKRSVVRRREGLRPPLSPKRLLLLDPWQDHVRRASQCGPAPPRGSSGRMLHGCAPARPPRGSRSFCSSL